MALVKRNGGGTLVVKNWLAIVVSGLVVLSVGYGLARTFVLNNQSTVELVGDVEVLESARAGHDVRIALVEQATRDIKGDIGEIKDDIDGIDGKLDRVLEIVRGQD